MEVAGICRLCLESDIYEKELIILNENEHLVNLILQFLTIEIVQDSLENYYICCKCRNILEAFNEFKTDCLKNDHEFRAKFQFKQEITWNDEQATEIQLQHTSLHTKWLHLEPLIKTETTDISNIEPSPNVETTDDLTTECRSKTRKAKSSFVRDRRKIPCHICGKLVSNATYTVHVSLHNVVTRQFSCKICNRSYRQKHNLIKHLNSHTKKVMFPCDFANCGKQFDSASTLRKHHKIMHTDVRDHVCKICGRGFAIASGLSGHMRTKHCTEKTNACPECGKLFKTPGEVKLHMKIHTRREPYVCPECNQAFPKAAVLKEHRAQVHNFPNLANISKLVVITK